MRNLIIIGFLISFGFITILGCTKKDKKEDDTLKEKITGIWIGVEYPETDTAFFYENNTVKFTGRVKSEEDYSFVINHEYITITSNNISSSHSFSFSDNYEKVYIGSLLITVGMEENGIYFIKQN